MHNKFEQNLKMTRLASTYLNAHISLHCRTSALSCPMPVFFGKVRNFSGLKAYVAQKEGNSLVGVQFVWCTWRSNLPKFFLADYLATVANYRLPSNVDDFEFANKGSFWKITTKRYSPVWLTA